MKVQLLTFLLIALAAVLVFRNNQLIQRDRTNGDGAGSEDDLSYRIPSNGIVVITNAASGPTREVAILLAKTGLHVLAGVKKQSELRSFAYEAHKGLETVVLDVGEQDTVLKVTCPTFFKTLLINLSIRFFIACKS